MTLLNHLKRSVPLIILCALFSLLAYELFYAHPHEQPSVLINEPLPPFELNDLLKPPQLFTDKNLINQVSLLNIWASWCSACSVEHALLLKISRDYRIPLYGINYKDTPEEAARWLKEKGNPYRMVGSDQTGKVGIDLGIYGTPETFVINKQGKIVYRYVGALTQSAWDEVLYPIVKQLQTT